MVYHHGCVEIMVRKIYMLLPGWKHTVECVKDLKYGKVISLQLNVTSSHLFRSVHNVRIEQLWVDFTAQVGAAWADNFTLLEICYGLDINNAAHIWLLHFLFLGTINTQLAFFCGSVEPASHSNAPFSQSLPHRHVCHGVRGDCLPPEEEGMDAEELEVYGINWRGLRDNGVLRSQSQNNSSAEGSSPWVGHVGPPPDLSQVVVQHPPGTLTDEEATHLYNSFSPLFGSADADEIVLLWAQALAYVHVLYPNVF